MPILLGRWRQTSSLTAALGTEFAAGNLNNVTLRNGMSYRCEWRGMVSAAAAASSALVYFKYGSGLTNTGGTIISEGQFDFRASGRAVVCTESAILDWTGSDTVVNIVFTLISSTGATTVGYTPTTRAAFLEVYEYTT